MSVVRFLHLGDVHLGATTYHDAERARDYFRALWHVIQTRALAEPVDFVVIAGDLFDKRSIEPGVLTQATLVFEALRARGIPVFAIEGNHDRSGVAAQVSWLHYLSDWQWLTLLEPEHQEGGGIVLQPWDEDTHQGGYLDYRGVRIVGSRWYGSATAAVVPRLAEAIASLPGEPYTLLMFHAGLEGYLDHYGGGVSARQLLPLREAGVRYLALGHIHKQYEEDGWLYNPGSLEALNVAEHAELRGAYLVEVDPVARTHVARHLADHPQRPFHRLRFDVTGHEGPGAVLIAIEAMLATTAPTLMPRWPVSPEVARPVVELTLHGKLGFRRHELELSEVEARVRAHCDPLLTRVKYDAVPIAYAVAADVAPGLERQALERQVIHDLVCRDVRYEPHAAQVAQAVLALKQQVLGGATPAELAAYVAGVVPAGVA